MLDNVSLKDAKRFTDYMEKCIEKFTARHRMVRKQTKTNRLDSTRFYVMLPSKPEYETEEDRIYFDTLNKGEWDD